MIRYYCNWCGEECDDKNALNTVKPRKIQNSGDFLGKGPVVNVVASLTIESSGGVDAHICDRCLGRVIRKFLLGESVEAP